MKRIVVVLLVAFMAFSITGCHHASSPSPLTYAFDVEGQVTWLSTSYATLYVNGATVTVYEKENVTDTIYSKILKETITDVNGHYKLTGISTQNEEIYIRVVAPAKDIYSVNKSWHSTINCVDAANQEQIVKSFDYFNPDTTYDTSY